MKKRLNLQWDEIHMEKAIELAEMGRGSVSPNPVVGACVVKNNKLISTGYHAHFGESHAEVVALQRAGKKAKGATLYITLEPCSTSGKTAPCTEAIIKSKIKRVVVGAPDLNPKHRGKAFGLLKRSGIKVTSNVLKKQAFYQNESFFKWIQTKKPFVILKMAQSLDGKIASKNGVSKWISGPEARDWVHQLRASVDAVLVGKNTALIDNPRLSPYLVSKRRMPWRIVLDASGQISTNARLFQEKGPVVLVCANEALRKLIKKYKHTNAIILPVSSRSGKLNLNELLLKLGALGISSLLIEGGGETAWSFLSHKLVDKVYWITAPLVMGGAQAKTSVEGAGFDRPEKGLRFSSFNWYMLGKDAVMEGYLN